MSVKAIMTNTIFAFRDVFIGTTNLSAISNYNIGSDKFVNGTKSVQKFP